MKEFLTTAELAEVLNVSTETIRRRTRDGSITPVRIGNSVRYRLSDIVGMRRTWSPEEYSQAVYAISAYPLAPGICAEEMARSVMFAVQRAPAVGAIEA